MILEGSPADQAHGRSTAQHVAKAAHQVMITKQEYRERHIRYIAFGAVPSRLVIALATTFMRKDDGPIGCCKGATMNCKAASISTSWQHRAPRPPPPDLPPF